MSYTNFDNFVINDCLITENDGDYLFNLKVNGNIDFNNCNINMNDIDSKLIVVNETNSSSYFNFHNSNITENKKIINASINETGIFQTMECLIDVINIRSVLLSQLQISEIMLNI